MPSKSHASCDKAKVLADSIQSNTKVLMRYIAALSGQQIPGEVAQDIVTKLRKMLFNIPAVYNQTWPFQQASLATKAQKIESQDIFSAVAMAQNDILDELHAMVPLSREAIYYSKIDGVVRFLEIGEQRPRKGWEYAMNKGYLCNLTLNTFLINFGLDMDVLQRDFATFDWERFDGYGKSRETRKWHQLVKALADHIMCTYLLGGSKTGGIGPLPEPKPRSERIQPSHANPQHQQRMFSQQQQGFAQPREMYFVDREGNADVQMKANRPSSQEEVMLFSHRFAVNSSAETASHRPSPPMFQQQLHHGPPSGAPMSQPDHRIRVNPPSFQQPMQTDMPPLLRPRSGSTSETGSMGNMNPNLELRRTMPQQSVSYPLYHGDDVYTPPQSNPMVYDGGSHSVGNVAVSQGGYSIASSISSIPSQSNSVPVSTSSLDIPILAEAVTAPSLRSLSMSTPNLYARDATMSQPARGHVDSGGFISGYSSHGASSVGTPTSSVGPQSAPNLGWSQLASMDAEPHWSDQTKEQFVLMNAAAMQLQRIQQSFQNLAAQAATDPNPREAPRYSQPSVPQPTDFSPLTFDNSQYFNNPAPSMDVDQRMDVDMPQYSS